MRALPSFYSLGGRLQAFDDGATTAQIVIGPMPANPMSDETRARIDAFVAGARARDIDVVTIINDVEKTVTSIAFLPMTRALSAEA